MKKLALALLFALALSVSSHAQAAPATVDLSQELHDVFGKPFVVADGTSSMKNLTLADAIINALETSTQQDQKLTGEEKFKLDELARAIILNKKMALTVEQIATVKERIGHVYGAAVTGAAWRALDPSLAKK